jgi:hypothetical protein
MQRCKAKSKRSGNQCKNFAIRGWGVCRMHGAGGGPKTQRGFLVCKKAPYKHGLYSCEAIQEWTAMKSLLKKENISGNVFKDDFCLRKYLQFKC